ncbi:UNVERIFIED_CONTAM: hypothetical protein FKN15_064497 [Acipenser sinensis]
MEWWYTLHSKSGKKEKERGTIQVTVQFTRNNLTASMFDLSMKDKPRSTFGKFKDKMKGKKRGEGESASAIVPSGIGALSERGGRSASEGGGEQEDEEHEEGKRSGVRGFFKKPKLRKSSDSHSNTSLASGSSVSSSPGGSLSPTAGISVVVSDLSNSPSISSNLTDSPAKTSRQAMAKAMESALSHSDEQLWYTLHSKSGKKEKERGTIQVTVQFTRNNLTASMFDLSMKDKPRSTFGKFKDKMKGKKRGEGESASAIVPSGIGALSERGGRSASEGGGEQEDEEHEEGKRSGVRGFFKKPKLRKSSDSHSNTSLASGSSVSSSPGGSLSPTAGISVVVSDLSNSPSISSNLTDSPVHTSQPSPKLLTHKRAFSDEASRVISMPQHREVEKLKAKDSPLSQSSLCINGSHIYAVDTPAPSTLPKALTSQDHAALYHLTHDELIALLLEREAELDKRGAELQKFECKVHDLEEYIDRLLVRIIEETPTMLQWHRESSVQVRVVLQCHIRPVRARYSTGTGGSPVSHQTREGSVQYRYRWFTTGTSDP